MKMDAECIPCFKRSVKDLIRKFCPEDKKVFVTEKMQEVLAKLDFTLTPPENARNVYKVLEDLIGCEDFFIDDKDKSTGLAKEAAKKVEEQLENEKDVFGACVKLAIGGNIIDMGAYSDLDLPSAVKSLSASLDEPIDAEALEKMRIAVKNAENVLYVLDNCGEAVFDAMLIKLFAEKVTIAVRGFPVLNDVTRRELEVSGLEGLAGKGVVDTGDRTPGVSMKFSSKEFLSAYGKADLVIAKGQGNYESLCDEAGTKKMVFLYRVKCPVVAAMSGSRPDGRYMIETRNL